MKAGPEILRARIIMTYQEAIERWQTSNRGEKLTPEMRKRVIGTLFNAANKRIARAGTPGQRTRDQELFANAFAMRAIQDRKSDYYLPEGRFKITGGMDTKAEQETVDTAVKWLGLQTSTIRGATENWKDNVRYLKSSGKSWVLDRVMEDKPIIVTDQYGNQAYLNKLGDVTAKLVPNKAERELIKDKIRTRNAEINQGYKAVVNYVDSMTAEEISDFWEEYRRYVADLYRSGAQQTSRIREYDPVEDKPMVVLTSLIMKGVDPSGNWSKQLNAMKHAAFVNDLAQTTNIASLTKRAPGHVANAMSSVLAMDYIHGRTKDDSEV